MTFFAILGILISAVGILAIFFLAGILLYGIGIGAKDDFTMAVLVALILLGSALTWLWFRLLPFEITLKVAGV